MRVLFRGEKRRWLQMWGADVGRANTPALKVTDAKYVSQRGT